MKMRLQLFFISFFCTCFLHACTETAQPAAFQPPDEIFKKQWYGGQAELSSFDLQQARYGEIRKGEAVLIFVAEDFSPVKFVKLDNPSETTDKVSVLKMNMAKTFRTGIYPYSMMLSVFKPISKDGLEKALKVSCSSQEWCGHTYSDLRWGNNVYVWQLQSYFEKEAGFKQTISDAIAEDEIWNHIRMNPATLPRGKISMIPGLIWQRLSHQAAGGEEVIADLSDTTLLQYAGTNVKAYTMRYSKFSRTLQIFFNSDFPHNVLGWNETYPDGFGANRKLLTSKATLKKTIWLEYWKLNTVADSSYRDSLQLTPHD